MNQADEGPIVLVAPLDWGLGHATRCIPVIQALLAQNCKVIIAASGKGKAVLQQEFPLLPVLHLPGYEIEYAASAWGLAAKIVAQIPKLLQAIRAEQAWLQELVAQQRIDAVISDNRYGLHHPKLTSVFITHQLSIKAPLKTVEDLLQKTVYRYINRFDECWVPDVTGSPNLAGDLSHPPKKPAVPLSYTGPLSRFKQPKENSTGEELLVLLSGPEPQRTLLEKQLIEELKNYTGTVVFIRGLPGSTEEVFISKQVKVYNHLPAAELKEKLNTASMVISRCGYSTVMDLATLQKRSILIPTPGQTEQEYLAKHLMQRNLAFCVAQKKFRLKAALELAAQFAYKPFDVEKKQTLQAVVSRFVLALKPQTENKNK